MGTLTGQQINNTYDGLLKLADSTTGITQSLQNIQDGLGNDTPLKIKTGYIMGENFPCYQNLKARYYGAGYAAVSPQQMANGLQNIIIAFPFYDQGIYSYSAMSYNVVTGTSSSDVVTAAFYTPQMTSSGVFPYEPILSGISLTTTAGVQTTTFATDLSFSGYGAGLYFLVYKIANAGVQPTIRFGAGAQLVQTQSVGILGVSKTPGSNTYNQPVPVNSSIGSLVLSGQTTFDNPFASTIPNTQSQTTTFNGSPIGFILHTTNF